MSVQRPSLRTAPTALRWAGLVMVLAGLSGMHGLTGPNSMAVPGSGLAAVATVPPSVAGPLADQPHQMGETPSGSGSESGHGSMAMDIAMMCLAVLGAGLVVVLRLLRDGPAALAVWSLPRRPASPVRYRGRDPDPPSLIELSIQRC